MHCRPYTLKCAFTVVGLVSHLEYLEAYVDGKARSYLLSILRLNFIVTLVTIDNISTSETMWPHGRRGSSKGTSHCHLPATTREGRSRGICLATLYEGAVELAVKFEVQPSKSRNAGKVTVKTFLLTPLSVLEEGDVPIIHGPLAAGNKHMTVSGSRSLRSSVHHTETTGTPDNRKNSPATSCSKMTHAWRSASITKRRWYKTGHDECHWETRHTRRHDSINQSRPIPNVYTAVVIY